MSEESVLKDLLKIKENVLVLLKKYPETRNNDFMLQWYWMKYFAKLPMGFIDWKEFPDLSGKLESIRRTRQKIQNEMEIFLPTNPLIREERFRRSQIMKRIIKDKSLIKDDGK